MPVRLEDAAAFAVQKGETHYAFPMIEGMTSEDLVVVIVSPDSSLGWRLTMLEGRYDGEMKPGRTGHPTRSARRQMANLIFHPAARTPPREAIPAVELIRMLEDYEDDVILHPRAVRTVVEARRAEDSRIPIARPSPFSGLLRSAGILGGVLTLANTFAVLGLLLTWGHTPQELRHYVLSTTLVTLAMLTMSPFLLSRLSRESRLFARAGAQRQGRVATIRVGQMVIFLAVLSAVNGFIAIS